MHLALAEEILRQNDLTPAVHHLLAEQRGPFLLGNTAPDVKTVSGQRREESHFYTIPRTSERPAHETLFNAYPELGHAERLSPPHAAFIAGYIAHLLLDEIWLDDIFQACFLQDWGPRYERLFLHNVLRTWMDYNDQRRLNGNVVAALREAEPRGWLPFVSDEHLRVWRDWLVEQLGPGQKMETAEVFARRMGIPTAMLEAVAQSPQQMERRIFSHCSQSVLQTFHEMGYERSVELIEWYLVEAAIDWFNLGD